MLVVVLCESFTRACLAFREFVAYIQELNGDLHPYHQIDIREIYDHCNCVETDEDLRYLFVDYRMKEKLAPITPDILWDDEFFEDIVMTAGRY